MNETAQWIEANWVELKEELHYSFNSHFSRTSVKIDTEDWIQDFVIHLIEKDSISKYLAAGAPRKIGQSLPKVFAFWGYRFICSRIKRQAIDLIPRLYGGVQTETEFRKGCSSPKIAPIKGITKKSPDPLHDQVLLRKEISKNIKWWVDVCFPTSEKRYLNILERLLLGCTVAEIRDSEGVSQHRMLSIIAELRHRIREKSDTLENLIEPEYMMVM